MQESILIVDDSKVSVMILKDILKQYEVDFVNTGLGMWEFLKSKIPSVILMDIMLPDSDGYQLTQELQKMEEYKSIP